MCVACVWLITEKKQRSEDKVHGSDHIKYQTKSAQLLILIGWLISAIRRRGLDLWLDFRGLFKNKASEHHVKTT